MTFFLFVHTKLNMEICLLAAHTKLKQEQQQQQPQPQQQL